MVLNYIWIAFFLIAFAVALVRLVFLGDTRVFPEIINSTFSSSKTAFEISLGLTGVLSLWLGIMKIGEKRASGDREHFYESGGKYAGIGQCCHTVRFESDGRLTGTKPKERHSH